VNRQAAFGEKLRRERERREITLQTIAQSTKIASGLLTALERGDCSRWPGGVYSRAYVRSYAEALGLDPKRTADEFCECFPATAWPDEPPAAASPNGGSRSVEGASGHDTVEVEALRLTLDPMPGDRWRRLGSGLAARLAVAGAAVIVAGVASMVGVDFWMALSATSLAAMVRHLI
jgi:transcriptional regulator with XRE-family HTH domain